MQNDTLATGIMSFVMHEAVYFGRSLPWIIVDAIPAFNKYKIQNVRSDSTTRFFSIPTVGPFEIRGAMRRWELG